MSKTALLFAGQGAQVVGMGKDLAEKFPSAKAWFDRANAALGYDHAGICFNGPEADLTKTENAQPGIFLVSWVAFQLLKEQVPNLKFDATAGLSLGEFTALTAAGAMSFEDGLRVVRQRGKFMQEACDVTKGGMAAIIGLDEAPTREVCAEAGVVLANLNCPGQLVISGETEKIAKACELAKAKGAKRALPLPVAGAYHSPLMASAQPKLAAELARVNLVKRDHRAGDLQRQCAAARHRRPNHRVAGGAGHGLGAVGKIHARAAGARIHAVHRTRTGHGLERFHETYRQDRDHAERGGCREPGSGG